MERALNFGAKSTTATNGVHVVLVVVVGVDCRGAVSAPPKKTQKRVRDLLGAGTATNDEAIGRPAGVFWRINNSYFPIC